MKPFPMCFLVFSIVAFRFTFEKSPSEITAALFGSVKPSILIDDAETFIEGPTRVFIS